MDGLEIPELHLREAAPRAEAPGDVVAGGPGSGRRSAAADIGFSPAPTPRAPEARLPEPHRPEARTPAETGRRMEDLVRQYRRLIRVMVARVGKRLPACVREDIEQRVFIALWKQLRRDQSIQHPTTYIYKAAVRETMRVRRQEGARSQEPLEQDGPAARLRAREDPHVTLDRKEKMDHIRAALRGIAPDRRQAVTAHLTGYQLTEIMRRFNWPYHKARNLVARGLADVRRALLAAGVAPVRYLPSEPPVSRRPPLLAPRAPSSLRLKPARPPVPPRQGDAAPRTAGYQAVLRRMQRRPKGR
jgi:RNA polymerase sigma factor (sigma-70 family)